MYISLSNRLIFGWFALGEELNSPPRSRVTRELVNGPVPGRTRDKTKRPTRASEGIWIKMSVENMIERNKTNATAYQKASI